VGKIEKYEEEWKIADGEEERRRRMRRRRNGRSTS
jgi:hypothetical protein